MLSLNFLGGNAQNDHTLPSHQDTQTNAPAFGPDVDSEDVFKDRFGVFAAGDDKGLVAAHLLGSFAVIAAKAATETTAVALVAGGAAAVFPNQQTVAYVLAPVQFGSFLAASATQATVLPHKLSEKNLYTSQAKNR